MKWHLENQYSHPYTINLEKFKEISNQRHGAAGKAAIDSGALRLFYSIPIVGGYVQTSLSAIYEIDNFKIKITAGAGGGTAFGKNATLQSSTEDNFYSFYVDNKRTTSRLRFNEFGLSFWGGGGELDDVSCELYNEYHSAKDSEVIGNIIENFSNNQHKTNKLNIPEIILFFEKNKKFMKSFSMKTHSLGYTSFEIYYFNNWLKIINTYNGKGIKLTYDFVEKNGIISDREITDDNPVIYNDYELLKHYI